MLCVSLLRTDCHGLLSKKKKKKRQTFFNSPANLFLIPYKDMEYRAARKAVLYTAAQVPLILACLHCSESNSKLLSPSYGTMHNLIALLEQILSWGVGVLRPSQTACQTHFKAGLNLLK